MADAIEAQLAVHLRLIARQVKEWEDRDLREAAAADPRHLSRPAYFADLENIAAMLEGKHREHRLRVGKSGRGRPGNVANVDRDLEIARIVKEHSERAGGTVAAGIEAAVTKFNVSPKTAEKAWAKMGRAVGTEHERIITFFERLAVRGMAKVTRHKAAKK
jgi:hypothetical protein